MKRQVTASRPCSPFTPNANWTRSRPFGHAWKRSTAAAVSTMPKLKVALLGGAFDPPTLGHIAVAKLVLDATNEFDEVWLTPCFKHMYNKQMSSAADRLTAILHMAQGDGRIKTFDYEIKNQLAVDTPQGLSLRKSVCGTPATSKRWTTTCAWLSRPGAPLVERKLLPLTCRLPQGRWRGGDELRSDPRNHALPYHPRKVGW